MTKNLLDITVRICSYNRPEYLREAVLSVLGQSREPRTIEIFDNASEPAVFKAIKDLLVRNVKWQTQPENIGGAENIQLALQGADTKYLFVMHDDDRILPDFLEGQVAFLEKHPECAAVACQAFFIDERGNRIKGHWPAPAGNAFLFSNQQAVAEFYAIEYLGFPSLVYNAKHVSGLRFRPNLGKVADVGLIVDLAGRGNIGFQNRLLYEYRIHSTQDSSSFREHTVKQLLLFLCSYFNKHDARHDLISFALQKRLLQTFLNNWKIHKSGIRELIIVCSAVRTKTIFKLLWQRILSLKFKIIRQ